MARTVQMHFSCLTEIGSLDFILKAAFYCSPRVRITADLGNRADRKFIALSPNNVAAIISGSVDVFYLNARIEL